MSTEHFAAPALQVDLFSLRSIVQLAAFASEAERVLHCLDFMSDHKPGMREELGIWIPAHRQWGTLDYSISAVLDQVARQLTVLAEQQDEVANRPASSAPAA